MSTVGRPSLPSDRTESTQPLKQKTARPSSVPRPVANLAAVITSSPKAVIHHTKKTPTPAVSPPQHTKAPPSSIDRELITITDTLQSAEQELHNAEEQCAEALKNLYIAKSKGNKNRISDCDASYEAKKKHVTRCHLKCALIKAQDLYKEDPSRKWQLKEAQFDWLKQHGSLEYEKNLSELTSGQNELRQAQLAKSASEGLLRARARKESLENQKNLSSAETSELQTIKNQLEKVKDTTTSAQDDYTAAIARIQTAESTIAALEEQNKKFALAHTLVQLEKTYNQALQTTNQQSQAPTIEDDKKELEGLEFQLQFTREIHEETLAGEAKRPTEIFQKEITDEKRKIAALISDIEKLNNKILNSTNKAPIKKTEQEKNIKAEQEKNIKSENELTIHRTNASIAALNLHIAINNVHDFQDVHNRKHGVELDFQLAQEKEKNLTSHLQLKKLELSHTTKNETKAKLQAEIKSLKADLKDVHGQLEAKQAALKATF